MSKLKYALAAGTVVSAIVTLAPGLAGASGSDEAAPPVVVVSGLNNPRQLSLHGNELLIAEAGKGGDTVVAGGPDGGSTFVGYSGSVSQVLNPQSAEGTSPNRIVTGLLSAASSPDGLFAVGSDGVSSRSTTSGIYVQNTFAPPDVLPAPPGTSQDGRLLRANRSTGAIKSVANISAFEQANDPDGHGVDSNPYAVLALPDRSELVADAAANDVLRVSNSGISVFHVFPNTTYGRCSGQEDPPGFPGCNFVPTSLARDSAGNIYVGGLGSEVKNHGQVVKLSPDGSQVMKTWSGFHSVTGVAVGRDGTVYVSQLEARESNPVAPMVKGVVTQVKAHNVRTSQDVPFPAGLAVDGANNVYVAAWSVSPETGIAGPGTDGQVWRLTF